MSRRRAQASGASSPTSHRHLRVAEQMRHLLAEHLGRGEARDPALDGRSLTISEVRLSPDLRAATVFTSELGRPLSDEAAAALRRAAGRLAGRLAREMNLRCAPRLTFVPDEVFDYAAKIEQVLIEERGRINPLSGEEDTDAGA